MASVTERNYDAVVVRVGNELVMGYLPKNSYLDPGDIVDLETGQRGIAVLIDDYKSLEDLHEIEENTGTEFVKIMMTYRKKNIEWEEA